MSPKRKNSRTSRTRLSRPGRPPSSADPRPAAGPAGPGLRAAIERRSAVPLLVLHSAPRWVLPISMAAVFIAGLLLAGVVGALLLGLLALFFAWLAFLSWPTLKQAERTLRCVVVATLLLLGLLQSGLF
ncbi:hypothetical protein GCM10027294_01710 [Marinactinospora endophytica]